MRGDYLRGKDGKAFLKGMDFWKLIVSVLTPLTIFYLGLKVAEQSRNEERAAQVRAVVTEKTARLEAIRRDDVTRREAAIRDAQIRNEAFGRERQLREEGYRRSEELRRATVDREDRLRAEMDRAGKLALLHAKRAEFWERFLPKLTEAHETVQDLTLSEVKSGNSVPAFDKVYRMLDQADDILVIYSPYFDSMKMKNLLISYRNNVERSRFIAMEMERDTSRLLANNRNVPNNYQAFGPDDVAQMKKKEALAVSETEKYQYKSFFIWAQI